MANSFLDGYARGYEREDGFARRRAGKTAANALLGRDPYAAEQAYMAEGMPEQAMAVRQGVQDETMAGEQAQKAAAAERIQQLGRVMTSLRSVPREQRDAARAALIPQLAQYGISPEIAEQIGQAPIEDVDLDQGLSLLGQEAQKLEIRQAGRNIYAIDPRTGRPISTIEAPQDDYTIGNTRFSGRDNGVLAQGESKPEYIQRNPENDLIEVAPARAAAGGGGDWLSSVASAAPDAQVTSGYRSPAHNARVGGVPNSRHTTGQAVDLVPRRGETMAQLHARVSRVPGVRAINEGDHVHVQATGGRSAAGPRVIAQGAPKQRETWVQNADGSQTNSLTNKVENRPAAPKVGSTLKAETGLRKEFKNEPDVKAYNDVSANFRQVRTLASKPRPTPSDDTALTFSFMKMLDPGSVVREGEFALVGKGAGLDDRVVTALAMVDQGKILPPSIRRDLISSAERIYTERRSTYDSLVEDYRGIAEADGLRSQQVVRPDAPLNARGGPPSPRPSGMTTAQQATIKQFARPASRRNGPKPPTGSQRNPHVIANDAQHARIPAGAYYIAPDGSVRQKGRAR